MKRKRQRGVAIVEFTLSSVALIPLLLGTGVFGMNMIKTQAMIQLARDAGHMYANTGESFYKPGYITIVGKIGADSGLSTTTGSGTAVVYLSELKYVDAADCVAVGKATSDGTPTSDCTNYKKFAITQRLVIGNTSVASSRLGTPTGVTIDAKGLISQSDYTLKAGAVATFSGINPYDSANKVGMPTNQYLYIAEAAAKGVSVPPFQVNPVVYSSGMF